MPICSVSQLRLYVATATHCAGTCSSSFTHQKRLASHFGTGSNATDSSCAGTHRMRNIFLKNLTKSPRHLRCILPSANSCPSLPHSFPDLNCKTITLPEQTVERRPLNSWSCTTALGVCADTTNVSGGSKAGTSRHHRGEQPAPDQVSLPFTVTLSLCPHATCTARCWWVRAEAQAVHPPSVGGCKQDPFAQGFSRRASLESALKTDSSSCEPVRKWPEHARGISERSKHLKCRCSRDTYLCC